MKVRSALPPFCYKQRNPVPCAVHCQPLWFVIPQEYSLKRPSRSVYLVILRLDFGVLLFVSQLRGTKNYKRCYYYSWRKYVSVNVLPPRLLLVVFFFKITSKEMSRLFQCWQPPATAFILCLFLFTLILSLSEGRASEPSDKTNMKFIKVILRIRSQQKTLLIPCKIFVHFKNRNIGPSASELSERQLRKV